MSCPGCNMVMPDSEYSSHTLSCVEYQDAVESEYPKLPSAFGLYGLTSSYGFGFQVGGRRRARPYTCSAVPQGWEHWGWLLVPRVQMGRNGAVGADFQQRGLLAAQQVTRRQGQASTAARDAASLAAWVAAQPPCPNLYPMHPPVLVSRLVLGYHSASAAALRLCAGWSLRVVCPCCWVSASGIRTPFARMDTRFQQCALTCPACNAGCACDDHGQCKAPRGRARGKRAPQTAISPQSCTHWGACSGRIHSSAGLHWLPA